MGVWSLGTLRALEEWGLPGARVRVHGHTALDVDAGVQRAAVVSRATPVVCTRRARYVGSATAASSMSAT